MGQNDTIILAGLGLAALFAFKKDINQAITQPVAQVTGAIGDIAQTGSRSLKEVSSVTEIVPVIVESTKETIFRESSEADERSRLRQEKRIDDLEANIEQNLIKEAAKTQRTEADVPFQAERNIIVEETKTQLVDLAATPVQAGADIKETFISIFRPDPVQIQERRASLKETASKIGSFLNPFD